MIFKIEIIFFLNFDDQKTLKLCCLEILCPKLKKILFTSRLNNLLMVPSMVFVSQTRMRKAYSTRAARGTLPLLTWIKGKVPPTLGDYLVIKILSPY